jgi:hypothetical protein
MGVGGVEGEELCEGFVKRRRLARTMRGSPMEEWINAAWTPDQAEAFRKRHEGEPYEVDFTYAMGDKVDTVTGEGRAEPGTRHASYGRYCIVALSDSRVVNMPLEWMRPLRGR